MFPSAPSSPHPLQTPLQMTFFSLSANTWSPQTNDNVAGAAQDGKMTGRAVERHATKARAGEGLSGAMSRRRSAALPAGGTEALEGGADRHATKARAGDGSSGAMSHRRSAALPAGGTEAVEVGADRHAMKARTGDELN